MVLPMRIPVSMTMAVGIPQEFADVKLAGLPKSTLAEVTRKYLRAAIASDDQPWRHGIAPCFLGPTREWKTYAAVVIAHAMADGVGLDTQFVSVPDVWADLETSRFTDTMRNSLIRWKTVRFLVLDDFAILPNSGFSFTVLLSVMSARFNARLPTLWTGNLLLPPGREWEAVATKYSALFARRLQDRATGYTVLIE
jgi:hypothetical protein